MSRYLVSTALEETWPDDLKDPILFLGEWCCLYSRKKRWSQMNAEVLPYHWDDRKKLYQDYLYLSDLYERLLPALGETLNTLQKVDHTTRYWRILIGPWLGYFIQMLFDRWFMLKRAFEGYEISDCRVLKKEESKLIPKGMADFNQLFVNDDWNETVYSQLLQEYFQNEFKVEQIVMNDDRATAPSESVRSLESWRRHLKKSASNLHWKAKQWMNGPDEYFFLSTYLPSAIESELQRRLGLAPKRWHSMPVPQVEVDIKERQWKIEKSFFSDEEFLSVASSMIPYHIPVAYLEGYKALINCTRNLDWPKNPKSIFTSNAHVFDDVFKAWAAQSVEAGSKMVIGQHGGHYGIGKWYYHEEHEISISDKYFSWGWSDSDKPKVVPIGQLKSKNLLGVNHLDKDGLAMVCLTMPRYSYHMYSTIMSSQYLKYLDDQFTFVENLSERIQRQLTVRLYQTDYGWEQEARWNDRFPNIKLDSGKDDINLLLKESRICICNYNATTYLESFSMNIPTVIFWNPMYWELRESAKPYFASLKDVGIFHETPESAAQHIISIWDDVEYWWSKTTVSKAVQNFCNRFSNISDDLLKSLYNEIKLNGSN